MQTINKMYKSTPTLEETEISKLESLLTQVGGNAKNILLSAEETSMAAFIDTCIRNGITFELRKEHYEKAGDVGVNVSPLSETAPVSNDDSSLVQSHSDKENSSEDGCEKPQKRLTRITLGNWKDLLDTGDEIVSFDAKGNRGVSVVTELEGIGYGKGGFMEVDGCWVYFGKDNTCKNGREYYVEE